MARVLIVEDEADMRMGLRDNVAFEGYEVLEADNGRDAVAITGDSWGYGRDRGYLLVDRKNEGRMRIPVDFREKVMALD